MNRLLIKTDVEEDLFIENSCAIFVSLVKPVC